MSSRRLEMLALDDDAYARRAGDAMEVVGLSHVASPHALTPQQYQQHQHKETQAFGVGFMHAHSTGTGDFLHSAPHAFADDQYDDEEDGGDDESGLKDERRKSDSSSKRPWSREVRPDWLIIYGNMCVALTDWRCGTSRRTRS